MTLLQELKQKRKEFNDSRILYIKQDLNEAVEKGFDKTFIDKKYWDYEIVNNLRNEGLTVEVFDKFESERSWYIEISGWE